MNRKTAVIAALMVSAAWMGTASAAEPAAGSCRPQGYSVGAVAEAAKCPLGGAPAAQAQPGTQFSTAPQPAAPVQQPAAPQQPRLRDKLKDGLATAKEKVKEKVIDRLLR